MSAISAEPITVAAPRIEVRPATRTQVRVARVPEYARAPQPRAVPQTRTQTRTRVAKQTAVWQGRALMFTGLFLTTWWASSLMGQVMTASAFGEGKHAFARAESARRALSDLRKRVDILTSDASAEMWASSHDMVDPALDRKLAPAIKGNSNLVALNR